MVAHAGAGCAWRCSRPVRAASSGTTGLAGTCPDRQISFLRYNQAENRVEVNTGWGPIFDTVPASFGVYGNPGSSSDPDSYLTNNPFQDLVTTGALNGADTATDMVASLCTGVFAWPFDLAPAATFQVDVRLPVDDYRGGQDLAEIRAPTANTLEAANRAFWPPTTGDEPAGAGRIARPAQLGRQVVPTGAGVHERPVQRLAVGHIVAGQGERRDRRQQ